MRRLSVNQISGWLVVTTCLFVLAAPACAGNPYLDNIIAASAMMEQGDYDRAVEEINSALVRRSNDPLAHLALGTVFLHTRQLDQAFKQFTKAHELSNNHPLALYGFAVYYLAYGKTDLARSYFDRAAETGVYDIDPTKAYLDVLSGRFNEDSSANPILRQIAAQAHFKRREYAICRQILQEMTKDWQGFDEYYGAVVTFDPKHPVSLTGRALSKPYKSPSQKEPDLTKVNGVVTLVADLSRADGIAYVLFYVDDEFIGMVNHAPFECQWDTTKYGNAPHTAKIEGHSADGLVLSEKSIRVIVDNESTSDSGPLLEEDVKRAEGKLWDCLRIKPSRRLAYYNLAKCADEEDDKDSAIAAMERVVAMDPEFKDARALLVKWYSPVQKYREIRCADTKQKIAAITFDDGPNSDTGRILDILSLKGVKATFFVVGSMAEAYPDILKRIADEGHQIENHTYSHRNLSYISDIEIQRELMQTAVIVRQITGRSCSYLRPPGGHEDGNLASPVGGLGYSTVFWTVNCSKNEGTSPDRIIKQVVSETVPGSIILMHNLEEVTVNALPKVIDDLRAKGYKLVTLSELLAAP